MLSRLKNKILGNKTILNGTLFTFFAFANQGVSFFLLLILAKYIAPNEYGQLNLFNTFIQFFSIFICLGTTGYVSVSFFRVKHEDLVKILNAILTTATVMLLVFFFILLLFSNNFEKIIGIKVEYQWLALVVCYFQIFNTLNLDIWRLEEKPISYGLYSLTFVVLNFILTLVLVILFNLGWLGRMYSQVSVGFIFFVISFVFLYKRNYLYFVLPGKKIFKRIYSYGIPLIPHLASGWLKQGADRYIINFFLSVTAVGLYSFAINFANIILIIGQSFNSTNSVFIYKNLSKGYLQTKARLKKQEKIMLLMFAVITLLIFSICYLGLPYFFPKYKDSSNLLLPLCLSSMFGCYYMIYVNYLFYYIKTKQLMLITFTASIFQVSVSYFLTRRGAIYTAYGSMATQLITFLAVLMYSKMILKEQEKIENNSKNYA